MAFDPAALGDELIVAGTKQKNAGTTLKEAAVELRGFGTLLAAKGQIDSSMVSVRKGVESINELLLPVVTVLQVTVNTLNGFKVPTIDPSFTTIDFPVVGKVKFVTGISIGSTHPLRSLAVDVEKVRVNIANIRAALTDIAKDMIDLRDELPAIQTRVLSAADGMETGATSLWDSGKVFQTTGKQLGGT